MGSLDILELSRFMLASTGLSILRVLGLGFRQFNKLRLRIALLENCKVGASQVFGLSRGRIAGGVEVRRETLKFSDIQSWTTVIIVTNRVNTIFAPYSTLNAGVLEVGIRFRTC